MKGFLILLTLFYIGVKGYDCYSFWKFGKKFNTTLADMNTRLSTLEAGSVSE